MATAVSTVGTVNRSFLNINGSNAAPNSVASSAFFGSSLRKVCFSLPQRSTKGGKFQVVAETDDEKQTNKDRWKGLAYDILDDQQDIPRGKGMVDSLFQAPQDAGTHFALMSSYEYLSIGRVN